MKTTECLPHHQRMFKFLGLIDTPTNLFEGCNGLISEIHIISVIVSILLTLLPGIAYFAVNITDIGKTTAASYIIGSMAMSFGMYCSLANLKPELKQLLVDLQTIADDSELIILMALIFCLL